MEKLFIAIKSKLALYTPTMHVISLYRLEEPRSRFGLPRPTGARGYIKMAGSLGDGDGCCAKQYHT